ncbi:hypothetical protein Ahy_B09g098012 [Arachis hypogaea]|uniref:Uncharacterized protein n=1 Tax=Arachis hypogaea TaxID=3818 RepID=A0A444XQY5_ARAHY|nr:hypothetical protein Ahy_B09g098012 [Arachis hypogaea]
MYSSSILLTLTRRTAAAVVGSLSLSWRLRESQRPRSSPPSPSFSRRSSGRSSLALSLSLPITLVSQPLSQPLRRCSLRQRKEEINATLDSDVPMVPAGQPSSSAAGPSTKKPKLFEIKKWNAVALLA